MSAHGQIVFPRMKKDILFELLFFFFLLPTYNSYHFIFGFYFTFFGYVIL